MGKEHEEITSFKTISFSVRLSDILRARAFISVTVRMGRLALQHTSFVVFTLMDTSFQVFQKVPCVCYTIEEVLLWHLGMGSYRLKQVLVQIIVTYELDHEA